MSNLLIDHLEETPGVVGGKPHIKGTRLSVHFIAGWIGEQTAEWVADAYNLTPAQIHAAWSYYYDHKERIDAEIKAAEIASQKYPSFREEMEKRGFKK